MGFFRAAAKVFIALEPTLRHPAMPGPRVNAMPSTSWTRIRASSSARDTAVGFDSGHLWGAETISHATYQVPLVCFDSYVRLDASQWSMTVHRRLNMDELHPGSYQVLTIRPGE